MQSAIAFCDIVRGRRALAEAYATHVLDIYDHFSWRWMIQSRGRKEAFEMLSVVPDEWQSRYFDARGNIKVAQLRFWLSALPEAEARSRSFRAPPAGPDRRRRSPASAAPTRR